MIFLTLGTTKFSFSRLLQAVDEALIVSQSKDKLIAQIGSNSYNFRYNNTGVFKEISFKRMIFYLSRARVVISHAGAGTLLLAARHVKYRPLVIPRSKDFNEHVDDHQIFLAKFLKKKKLIETVFPDEDLRARIGDYLKFPEKLPSRKKNPDTERLVEKLIEFTESLR